MADCSQTGAPLPRLLAAEVRWVLRRPRTLVMLGLFALIPVLIAIGVTVADRRPGPGRGLIGAVAGNGLVLPIAAMTVALALLLPLAVAMAAADAMLLGRVTYEGFAEAWPGRTVADSPMRCAGVGSSASSGTPPAVELDSIRGLG